MLQEQLQTEETTEELIPTEEPAAEPEDTLIDERFQKLQEAMDKLDAAEKARCMTWVKIQKTRRRYINITKFTLLVAAFALIVNFHREMGQVGWNGIQWIASVLNYRPQELSGLAAFLAAAWLLLTIAKWTFVAAAEDLFGGDDDDLSDL